MILVWTADITIYKTPYNPYYSRLEHNCHGGRPVKQLFVLQRVNRTFQASIRGSILVRRRMFLSSYPYETLDLHLSYGETYRLLHLTPIVWFIFKMAFKSSPLKQNLDFKKKTRIESSYYFDLRFELTGRRSSTYQDCLPGEAWLYPKA